MSQLEFQFQLGPQRMLPLEGTSLEQLLQIAHYNCTQFNVPNFMVWLRGRSSAVQILAARCPPNEVYKVITDAEAAGLAQDEQLYGIVLGYTEPARGVPAQVAVQLLGVFSGAGSGDDPLIVPPDVLVKVPRSV